METKIFVYGTLMSGMENHHLIQPYLAKIEPGWVEGTLYQLPYGYPALVLTERESRVLGEIITLDALSEAMSVMDCLEDYYGPDNPANLYDRVACLVHDNDGVLVNAYVYVWSHPEELPAFGNLITGGCWREYKVGGCSND